MVWQQVKSEITLRHIQCTCICRKVISLLTCCQTITSHNFKCNSLINTIAYYILNAIDLSRLVYLWYTAFWFLGTFILNNSMGPFLWSRVPETTLPLWQLYRAFTCENGFPTGRVKVDPSWLFITLAEFLNIPFSLSFLRSFDHSGFLELIFTSLIQIFALNP